MFLRYEIVNHKIQHTLYNFKAPTLESTLEKGRVHANLPDFLCSVMI